MDFEQIAKIAGYAIAIASVYFALRNDLKNLKTKFESEKEILILKFKNIELEIQADRKMVESQFLNKAEKVDTLFKFKDEISQTMTREFADLKNQISKVSEAVGNINTTLSLCDVQPKRRQGD